jgi:aminoglycoside phosphotransferase family enzyme/predicted kinase
MTVRTRLPEHIQALLSADAYPHAVDGDVRLIQTHVSYVLLTGEHVYKIKKPVNFGFIDYSTLPKRRQACEDEVRLNKRGCPEIYLDVVPITGHGSRYRIGGRMGVIDYAVHMKRLPEGRMMDELLAQDAVTLPMLGQLAGRLSEFHKAAERSDRITRIGGAGAFAKNWRDNIEALGGYVRRTTGPARLQRLGEFCESVLEDEAALLEARDRDGYIRDCHGDLRSDAVCFDDSLTGGIGFVDCIEFNDALRYTDTGLDIGFLAMDMEFRGRADLADVLVGLYCAATGDRELPLLLGAYRCYRAGVRGLVESLTLDRPEVGSEQKAGARRRARDYLELAESYAKRLSPSGIVLVIGPSGSGKSILAGALASRLGAVYLATDVLRREIATPREGEAPIDSGRYSQDQRNRVYGLMAEQAKAYVKAGRAVVLDGTYIEAQQRAPIVELAKRLQVPLTLVECTAPDTVVRKRQEQRQKEPWAASEGRWEVYVAQKERYEAPVELPAPRRIEVDSTRPLGEQIEAAMRALPRRRR